MNQTDVLLSFCDPEASRYTLDKPWAAGGWRYATDAIAAVRIPTTDLDTVDGERRPTTKLAKLFEQFPACLEPWPHHDGKMKEPDCPRCSGAGQSSCECPVCYDEHWTQCPECYGELKPLFVATKLLAGKQCLRIQAIGDVKYAARDNAKNTVAFASGALQGLVNCLPEEDE